MTRLDAPPASKPAFSPVVLIPARLAATRLPGKPLADIHGVPMIVHVWRRALEADVGPVIVAAGDPAILDAVRAAGGTAIATDPGHASGSDRIYEALQRSDPDGRYDRILNLQGDLPTLDPAIPRATLALLAEEAVDIGTAAALITREEERADPAVVKLAMGLAPGARTARALYFSRAAVPSGAGPLYHHIGLYAYRRTALARFVGLPPGILETREKLEQLRALEAGMRIDAVLVDTVPLGVDTPSDLDRARAMLAPGGRTA